jgi:hypothetical protein
LPTIMNRANIAKVAMIGLAAQAWMTLVTLESSLVQMAIPIVINAKPREGLKMTTRAETFSVVVVKCIYHIPHCTLTSNRSTVE